MSLRLSPNDAQEYSLRCAANQAAKEAAIAAGDVKTARRIRQADTALYNEFKRRELSEEAFLVQPLSTQPLTLEQRIERIEKHLGERDAFIAQFIERIIAMYREG